MMMLYGPLSHHLVQVILVESQEVDRQGIDDYQEVTKGGLIASCIHIYIYIYYLNRCGQAPCPRTSHMGVKLVKLS